MDWGTAAVVVAAVLGSGGLASLLSGGLEISRRSRLRRSIEKTRELATKFEAGSQEHDALQSVTELEGLRFAALTHVGLPKSIRRVLMTTWVLFGLVVAGTLIAAVLVRNWSGDVGKAREAEAFKRDDFVTFVAIAFIALFYVAALDALVRTRRAEFVSRVQAGLPVRQAAAQIQALDMADYADRHATLLAAFADERVTDWQHRRRRRKLRAEVRRRARRAFGPKRVTRR